MSNSVEPIITDIGNLYPFHKETDFKYENIESNAINTVKEVALFIKINLTEQNAELVSNKFSKEKVKSIIKKCEIFNLLFFFT